MTGETRYRPDPSIVFTQLDEDNAALLSLKTKGYYSLNETGLHLWKCLEKGMTTTEILALLEQKYTMEQTQATVIITDFLDELWQAGIIQKI